MLPHVLGMQSRFRELTPGVFMPKIKLKYFWGVLLIKYLTIYFKSWDVCFVCPYVVRFLMKEVTIKNLCMPPPM